MHDTIKTLAAKISNRTARPAVIGLGYVGLPLAFEFAQAGFQTTGIDVSAEKVSLINRGKNYVEDIDDQKFKHLVDQGFLKASTDFSILSNIDCVSICVPTPLGKNKEPDMSFIVASIEQVGKYLHSGQVIILESTTYPGTTEEIVLPLLTSKDLKVGFDFFLAFSPERIDPGNKSFGLRNTPKIVGGITSRCTEVAQTLYQTIIERVIPVSSPKTAEMVKLLENTFRAINIGLANEVALMCDILGIDVWEVIEAAKTKPFGFMPFYPGPGLGGHCIPIDSHYLSWKLRSHDFYSRFIELAAQINNGMPQHIIQKVSQLLNSRRQCLNGSNILVLGISYKKNIGDIRESPSLTIMQELQKYGARLSYSDPYVPTIQINGHQYSSVPVTREALQHSDCVIIGTDHAAFDYDLIKEHSPTIFDSRNALKTRSEKVWKL